MKNRLKRPSFDPNVLPENDYSHYHDYHLVGIRTPPTLLSLITPPIAVTRSRSRALLVLWSCQCLWGWFCLIFNANNHYSIIFHFQVILSFVIQMNSIPLPLIWSQNLHSCLQSSHQQNQDGAPELVDEQLRECKQLRDCHQDSPPTPRRAI